MLVRLASCPHTITGTQMTGGRSYTGNDVCGQGMAGEFTDTSPCTARWEAVYISCHSFVFWYLSHPSPTAAYCPGSFSTSPSCACSLVHFGAQLYSSSFTRLLYGNEAQGRHYINHTLFLLLLAVICRQ